MCLQLRGWKSPDVTILGFGGCERVNLIYILFFFYQQLMQNYYTWLPEQKRRAENSNLSYNIRCSIAKCRDSAANIS